MSYPVLNTFALDDLLLAAASPELALKAQPSQARPTSCARTALQRIPRALMLPTHRALHANNGVGHPVDRDVR